MLKASASGMFKMKPEQLFLVHHRIKYLYFYVLWSKSKFLEVIFKNDACISSNSFIGSFLSNPLIENCPYARQSGRKKLSKTKYANISTKVLLDLKPGPWGPIIEQLSLTLGDTCSHLFGFPPHGLNFGDQSLLEFGTFEFFLTRNTITFGGFCKPQLLRSTDTAICISFFIMIILISTILQVLSRDIS